MPEVYLKGEVMQLEIRGHNFTLTESLRRYAERRLMFALGRFRHHIRSVTARMADLNGPRGGVDKRFQVVVDGFQSREVLVIEQTDADMYVAIDRAVDRLARLVRRQVSRLRPALTPAR